MDSITERLETVRKLACSSKWSRLFYNPYKYIYAIFFREAVYPITKKEIEKKVPLFFGEEMVIALPASTDIYLTGGKSHDSEIRLAKWLIAALKEGDQFLDIGAHYGYFSLLASKLVGNNGKVFSFEPTSRSFSILRKNVAPVKNITAYQQAVSDKKEEICFYEFPNKFSEYNSMNATQFEQEAWFAKYKPIKTTVEATTIDLITMNGDINPKIIKIDVEGAEYKVISGALPYLQPNSPLVVLEYLEPKRDNEQHKRAMELLLEYGYKPYVIHEAGNLVSIQDADAYLLEHGMDSDNIVFRKD